MMRLEVITQEPEGSKRPTPLLFVHGMWDSAHSWAEYYLPYFARHGYQSHALSLRGHGASGGRGRLRWTRLSDYVADVAQVVSQLERPPLLIGHSMGGMIVQKYLEAHPLPAAVLMASPPPRGMFAATLRVAKRHPLTFIKSNLTLSLYPVIGSAERFKELLFSSDIEAEKLAGYFARMQDESFRAYLDMLFLDLPRPGRVKSKMLVLGAADDPTITRAEVESTAQAYRTDARMIPHMSHYMMLEQNWQTAADLILAWLAENNA